MKLNTLSKGIFTCILAGALIIGVNACSKTEESEQKNPVREYKIEKHVGYCQIILSPECKTGQTLEVFARVLEIGDSSQWYVKEKRLYEDGKLIKTKEGDINSSFEDISKTIIRKEQGVHSYYAEFVYHNGGIQKTETKSIEFTGKILDMLPSIFEISVSNDKLWLHAEDYGDNKGIIGIKVYENGKLWKELKVEPDESVTKMIPLDLNKEGRYTYMAEFTDKGGNIVKTEDIMINYQ